MSFPVESSFVNPSSSSSSVSLSSTVYGRSPIRADLIHRVVVWQLASRRQGTAKAKDRSEVSGSTRKGAPQKGRGKARVGSRRAPQFRHGGRVFPKTPRDFGFDLNKSIRTLGLVHVLSSKAMGGNMVIVEKVGIEEGKAKEVEEGMKKRGWGQQQQQREQQSGGNDTALVVVGKEEEGRDIVMRAAMNVKSVTVLGVEAINVYDIARHPRLVLTTTAAKQIQSILTQKL